MRGASREIFSAETLNLSLNGFLIRLMLLCLFVLFWSRRCVCFFVILHNSLSAKTVGTLCDGLSRLNKLHFYLVLFSLEIKICLLFLFQSSFTLKSIKRRLQINHLRRRNPLKMTKSIVWGGKSCDNPTTTFWKKKIFTSKCWI